MTTRSMPADGAAGSNSGKSIKTQTSPNSTALCTYTGDPNSTCALAFGNACGTVWATQVSAGCTKVVLGQDVGICGVTWTKGLTVKLMFPQSGQLSVILDGDIIDHGVDYPQDGTCLGTFQDAGVTKGPR